jgi:hypothetical protein
VTTPNVGKEILGSKNIRSVAPECLIKVKFSVNNDSFCAKADIEILKVFSFRFPPLALNPIIR